VGEAEIFRGPYAANGIGPAGYLFNMRPISRTRALQLLSKFKERTALIKLVLEFPSQRGSLLGFIMSVDGDMIVIQGSGSRAEFRLSLAGSAFEYSSSGGPPGDLQDRADAVYLQSLTATTPTGFKAAFIEIGDLLEG